MIIKEDVGVCTSCGNFSTYKYGEENFDPNKADLENYTKYKDVYVYECPKCGFISTDITSPEGVIFSREKNSNEYVDAINCSYLHGKQEYLFDNHYKSVPANLYEAYSFICLEQENYEMFNRVLNKAVELKEVMARKYFLSEAEYSDEQGNGDIYTEVINLIKQSAVSNRQKIDYCFAKIQKQNLFSKLLYVENKAKLGFSEQASKIFEKIQAENKIEDDVKQYFQKLF